MTVTVSLCSSKWQIFYYRDGIYCTKQTCGKSFRTNILSVISCFSHGCCWAVAFRPVQPSVSSSLRQPHLEEMDRQKCSFTARLTGSHTCPSVPLSLCGASKPKSCAFPLHELTLARVSKYSYFLSRRCLARVN